MLTNATNTDNSLDMVRPIAGINIFMNPKILNIKARNICMIKNIDMNL